MGASAPSEQVVEPDRPDAGRSRAPIGPVQCDRRAGAGHHELSDRALLLVTAAVTLPILWMGYGTDIDVADVLASGDSIRRGDYFPSRPPGVPVFEAITAALDPVGGHLLLNLATAAAGAATVVGIARLVRTWGHANGDLIALAFLASPMTLISATSTGDFIWAVAFFVWAALWHLRDRPLLRACSSRSAIGTRLSSVVLVLAFLVADGWDRDRRASLPAHAGRDPAPRRAALRPVVVGLRPHVRVPRDRRRLAVVRQQPGPVRLQELRLGGRAPPRRWCSWPSRRSSPRCVAGATTRCCASVSWASPSSQALFFVLPWKYNHLLPALLMLLLWLGASTRNRRPFLWLADRGDRRQRPRHVPAAGARLAGGRRDRPSGTRR